VAGGALRLQEEAIGEQRPMEPEGQRAKTAEGSGKGETRHWRRTLYSLWLAMFFVFLEWTFGMTFVPVFLQEDMDLTFGQAQSWTGLLMALPSLAMFVATPLWGTYSDRIGRKKTFLLLRPFSWLAELLLIVAPRPEALILVGVLGGNVSGGGEGGGIGGVSFIPNITMEWEMVPEAKRGRWHGILGLCRVLAFPAAILGGLLWQQGFKVEILLLPILLEAAVAVPILLTIPETLGRTSSL